MDELKNQLRELNDPKRQNKNDAKSHVDQYMMDNNLRELIAD